MVVNSVKVYARLKSNSNVERFDAIRQEEEYKNLIFTGTNGCTFRFLDIFDETYSQKDVFKITTKPVVESVLQGYNGTVFAYGQTGSGKTFTMTGSTKKYHKRGIIPRSLQFIFSAIEKIEDKPTICISYMEVYNEICYDLLSHRHLKVVKRLEDLPRVVLLEDKKKERHIRNLSVLPVRTEEEAMRLLFLGDTNRAIAETPSNAYSSRSHCIFTIYIRSNNDKKLILSKLNLVDLAGSERVHKSSINGVALQEAKHINLSLHYLQQVLTVLSQQKKAHIPYRNSQLTFLLKDSLGKKCLTVMLATVSMSKKNLLESISTCKFAQRVALIKVDPRINTTEDPYLEIDLLKNQVYELRNILETSKKLKSSGAAPLSTKKLDIISERLEEYLSGQNAVFESSSPRVLQHCLALCRSKIIALQENRETKPQSKEVEEYSDLLAQTRAKAKSFETTLEECQQNISSIREQYPQRCQEELQNHQTIYRQSLIGLKQLKTERLQLEAGLTKAKNQIRIADDNSERPSSCKFCNLTKSIDDNVSQDLSEPSSTSDQKLVVEEESEELSNAVSYEIFLETDTEEFKKFIKSVDLTGYQEVDKEICNFYRSRYDS